jgi:phosphatidylserine/phosphatidylglycerophosphate/cardiolipin synthase-like enzyme
VTRKTIALLLGVLITVGGLGTGAAFAYTPENGTRFNDPSGDREAVNRSMIHIRKTIESAKKGSIIRMATYTHNRADITNALIDACKNRHVHIQIVLNDNNTSVTTKRLIRVLGSNTEPHYKDACNPVKKPQDPDIDRKPDPEPSFVKICFQSCRKGAGNQHMKFYLFSATGQAENVVMVGSTNTTRWAANVHFNDLFTETGRADMFRDYSKIHAQLARDRRVKHPYWKVQHGDLVTEFGNVVRRGARDHVAKRLAAVSCAGGTRIRIVMYAWTGDRGLYLARRVAELNRKGCDVRAILSGASSDVKQALRNGGVAIRSADMDLDNNPSTGFGDTAWDRFTHEKWMALDGTWAGQRQKVVWTGSENWSGLSFLNDEVTIKIPRASIYNAYASHFQFLWDHRTRSF